MGCAGSSQNKKADGMGSSLQTSPFSLEENVKKIRKPKPWKHPQPITREQLNQMREEFWDTAPHYGGRREIWDALRAAAESELPFAQAIIDSAGVIVTSADLTTCYDERGGKYDLPKYVLSEPTNLIRDI
ncbi:hypothetical protein Syun_008924 [Stephania yunnanensis]|uniref:DC-UbP/UBTD2 N-terminal domain-containing protein n=1 Tax=Stephania yunnanensis TaxID=152371 RepID=A0AAP0KG78_9MAGN